MEAEDAVTMARSALPIGGSFARTSPSKEIKIVLPLLAAASSVDVKESCMHAMVILEAASRRCWFEIRSAGDIIKFPANF